MASHDRRLIAPSTACEYGEPWQTIDHIINSFPLLRQPYEAGLFEDLDLWDSFVGKEDMNVRDGLHLSGNGVAVFSEGLSGAVASGLGKVRYLN